MSRSQPYRMFSRLRWYRSGLVSAFLTLIILTLLPASASSETWNPQETRAIVIGVLKWEDPSLATWPDAGRKDAVFVETLKDRGVPASRIKYIANENATKAASLTALDETLAESRPQETLIFYYCGHGSRKDGSLVMLPYDNLSAGAISVAEIAKRIESAFKGKLVILFADCCYSGGLIEAADRIERAKIGSLVISSVVSSSLSTGQWTFTESLIDIFQGKIEGDLPGKGIGINAASDYVLENMRNADRQLACVYRTASFPASFEIVKERPPLISMRPQYQEALYNNKWYPVKILKNNETKSFVHYIGFESSWDEWLNPGRLRLPLFESFPVGTSATVEWNGKWYPAKVLELRNGFHLVRYDGYGPEWDEWVASPRIKAKSL